MSNSEELNETWRRRNQADVDIFKAIIIRGFTHTQAALRFKVKLNEPGKVIKRIMFAIHQELQKDKYADAHYRPGPDGKYDIHIYSLRHHKHFLVEVLDSLDPKTLNEILTGFYKQTT
jgi:hypothetical protein